MIVHYNQMTVTYGSSILLTPGDVSSDDQERLLVAATLTLEGQILMFEDLIARYGRRPYFLLQLSSFISQLGSNSVALKLYQEVQTELSRVGQADDVFNKVVEAFAQSTNNEVQSILQEAEKVQYVEPWKPTKAHRFPVQLPHAPAGHAEVATKWKALMSGSNGSHIYEKYLRKLAIETNHVEGTFLLTPESVVDIIHSGFEEGSVKVLEDSGIKDIDRIKRILKDTLEAFALLSPLVEHPENLDAAIICSFHSCIMKTCRLNSGYTAAGETRATTRKSVVITGPYTIQCCPFPSVDEELHYICRMAKQWIRTWRNPFATAAWIHLILVRCHPFDDGNGHLARLIASIPLVMRGYPPICVSSSHKSYYYDAISRAYAGDHSALADFLLQGMCETIAAASLW
ncbi:hypothetical protein HGRIS_010559 [Hohenbuehelia grisea]|uniref:Fido domain-containing protein n=1 Tax=Hohenbuehelia grisea TaxID=104357 RepID=A0ABR3IXB8_9AGAR